MGYWVIKIWRKGNSTLKALFDYFLAKDKYGYFVDNNCNCLFEYDINKGMVTSNCKLDNISQRWHKYSGIDIIEDKIIMYPMWNDRIVIHSGEEVDCIDVSYISKEGLHPLWFKKRSLSRYYAYKEKSFEIFRTDFTEKTIKKVDTTQYNHNDCVINECRNVVVANNNMFFLPNKQSEYIIMFSSEDEKINILKPEIGRIRCFLLDKDSFWIFNDLNEVIAWNPLDGIISKNKIRGDVTYRDGLKLLTCEDGLLILEHFNGGKVSLITNDGHARINISFNDVLCGSTENIEDAGNICVAYNNGARQFIQCDNGAFWVGKTLKYHDPIEIGISVMDGQIINEGRNAMLNDYIINI